MPKVVFTEPGGGRREIDAPIGITLMEAARQHGVQGVVAQCGGACICATCHVYIHPSWFGKLEPREEMEEGTLENAWEPRDNSRLSCQIHITAELDGLQVTVPQRQREVVAFRVFLDLDTASTAKALGIAPGTVTAHLARAVAALREELASVPPQEDRS